MKNIKGCLLHNTDDWKTPSKIYDHVIKLGFVDTFKYQSNDNEFLNTYKDKRLFVNPPFSKLNDVCHWILSQLNNDNIVLLLMPVRTDTEYFHSLLNNSPIKPRIFFIKGRLHFNDSKKVAPFPTMFLLFDKNFAFNIPYYSCVTIDEFLYRMRFLYV